MKYVFYNPNPDEKYVGDCTVRAISRLFLQDWESTYWDLCILGGELHDMPSADAVWGEYLRQRGYTKHPIRTACPYCYTIRDFCLDHPEGRYLLKTSGHVVAVVNGDYYDTSDSGGEAVIFYWAN